MNQVPSRIDLSSLSNRGWSCSVLSVNVSCRGFIAGSTMSFWSNIGLSKKTQRLILMFLQGKVDAASNWVWESSCSALPKKVRIDYECCFSAILQTHNKVCLLPVNNKHVKYLLLLDSSYSKHSKDKLNAVFIMLSVSVRYSACFGNVISRQLWPDINC